MTKLNGYAFDEKGHVHTLDGLPLHGITTVLKVISKPALIQWAANMAVQYVKENSSGFEQFEGEQTNFYRGITDELLEKARFAHRKKKEKAGDWGTIVHKAIEEWIKTETEPKLENEQQLVFDKFKEWVKENKIEFLESEKHVWSRNLWIGGITDGIMKMDGKKYVFDVKTSSAIYNEFFFQMAAYQMCLEEMGEHEDIEGYVVINLKKDGSIDFKRAYNMEVNRNAFLAALSLHKIMATLQ
mgnify:FL=1